MNTPVWVVDDDESYRELLAMVVETRCRQPVQSFASGEEAIRALDATPPAQHPGLLLLDFHMPGLDAPGVLRALRAARLSVPAAVLSGAATAEERAICEREGAVLFLEKPARIEDLAQALLRLTAPPAGTGAPGGRPPP